MNASTFGPFNAGRATRRTAAALALALVLVGSALAETTFTFQGRLGSAGAPATGPHDFEFRVFDAATGGTQISGDVARDTVDVTDGIFTVQLDFGDAPFNSAPRWLEVDVRESGGAAYTTLDTRFRVGAAPFAIEALFVGPGAVDTESLQDGAVTTPKIATGAVTRSRIASNAIGTQQIENNSVTSSDIRDGAVTTAELAADSVTTAKIADGAVDRLRMANNAVDTAVIADQTVTTNDIRDNNITSAKFVEGAVDSRAIQDGAVTTAKIADGAVDSAQVANQSIAAIDLASGSVGSDEIIDGTITPADVSGGLYSRKGQLYLRESSALVGLNKNESSVSCDDSNDLLVIAVCNAESPNNDLRLVQRRLTNIDNDVLPVGLRCQMENDNPTVPQRFSATVGCVAVP